MTFYRYCERRLVVEAESLGAVMSASDCADMLRTVQHVLLESNTDAILSGGLAALIDANRFQGLAFNCVFFVHISSPTSTPHHHTHASSSSPHAQADLSRMYSLFNLVNAHAPLRARFVAHVKATGLPLVQVAILLFPPSFVTITLFLD